MKTVAKIVKTVDLPSLNKGVKFSFFFVIKTVFTVFTFFATVFTRFSHGFHSKYTVFTFVVQNAMPWAVLYGGRSPLAIFGNSGLRRRIHDGSPRLRRCRLLLLV